MSKFGRNRRTLAIVGSVAILAGGAGVVSAQGDPGPPPPNMQGPITLVDRPDATEGEALYVEKCIMCHGPVGMGTGLLARKGRSPAELEKRGDLAAAFVVLAARNGIGNMPAVPRGEVSDEQLQEIADYLAAGPHGGDQ
ncbi:c-type cytochrome [Aurantiacibacter flavus]|uniref:Cytochrome c n=1 Tax=Aurantiacibacter flavus TaxID=3145232 RepID=A0ABV0CY41_9SPHN